MNGYIDVLKNRDGQERAYIAGTRIRVQDVALMAEFQEKSADEIVTAFPQLSLAQVHAALAYYFEHRAAIEQELRQDEEFVRALRSLTGPGPLEEYLASPESQRDPISP